MKGKNRIRLWPILVRAVGWLLLAVIFLPVFGVLAVRYIDPPFTIPMLLRRIEHVGRSNPPSAYQWVKMEAVSGHFIKAVWQTEDARFFQHNGFDWIEVDASVKQARNSGKPARGASTITMQCARSIFLWQGRSWIRKPLEAWFTILMETFLPKHRIFELYLNVIETGPGIYGVEAAARNYWHISARNLSVGQSVLLTSILPNPKARNPLRPSKKMRQRMSLIENRLQNSPALPE